MGVRSGRQIVAARALVGWSQSELAVAAGLHRNSVLYWEQRDVVPNPFEAVEFATLEWVDWFNNRRLM